MYQTGHPHCTRIHATALCAQSGDVPWDSEITGAHLLVLKWLALQIFADFCWSIVSIASIVSIVSIVRLLCFFDSFKTSVLPIALTGWELWLTIYIHLAGLGGHPNTLSPGWQVCGCELYNSLPADRWQCEYSLKAGNVRCSERELYWAGLGDWSKKKPD